MIQKIIITGPCCAGKTTLINLLKRNGKQIITESAREIIAEQIEKNSQYSLSTHKELIKFQYEVTQRQKEKELALKDGIWYLDRSIVDGIGYLNNKRIPIPKKLLKQINTNNYSKVFFLELLEEKYFKQDSERSETYEEALKLQNSILEGYKQVGFNPIILPNTLDPNQRLELILKNS